MLVFTAGVGENSAHVRRMIVDRLGALGIKIDREKMKPLDLVKKALFLLLTHQCLFM